MGDVCLILTLDEEIGSFSIDHALKHHLPQADLAIIGEPSDLALIVSHKGSQWIKVAFYGKACHASVPLDGQNAVMMAARFLNVLEDYVRERFPHRRHAACGQPTMIAGAIKGGNEFVNTIPDYCEIILDRRWTPNETIQRVWQDIHEIIDICRQRYPGFQAKPDTAGGEPGKIYPPLDFSHQRQLLHRITAALIKSGCTRVPQCGFGGWTEGALFEEAGIPAVIFGPGNIKQAHTHTEWVETTQVIQAAKSYYDLMRAFCGT